MIATAETSKLIEQLAAIQRQKLEIQYTIKSRDVAERQKRATEYAETERQRCKNSIEYFIRNYCFIYDASNLESGAGQWIRFDLWKEQIEVLDAFQTEQKCIALKARQIGLTWLALAFALHQMLFNPIASIIVYSLRDIEAMAMLGDEKLGGMYVRLPEFLKLSFTEKNNHKWQLSNGSIIRALPTTAGDSYTATIVIVDEADLIPNLNTTLQRVKPTVDAGGKLFLISRSKKDQPQSPFKKIYRAAKNLLNGYKAIFIPWHARPSRTLEWYEKEKEQSFNDTQSHDNLYESYPSTDDEALAPSTLNKRIPFDWLKQCYEIPLLPITAVNANQILAGNVAALELFAKIPDLIVFKFPKPNKIYRIGVDPAEGGLNSDETSINVVDFDTGEQMAVASGLFEVTPTANYVVALSRFYNRSPVLVERNNHGHAVIAGLQSTSVKLLQGRDEKDGWLDHRLGKVLLYDNMAELAMNADCKIYDNTTYTQLISIQSNSLKAPDGESDDRSDSYALAQLARTIKPKMGMQPLIQSSSKGWNKK